MATLGNFVSGQVLTAAELNAIGTYTSFTPTWGNVTVGNGTSTGYYCQINKLIHWSCELLFGSTTSITGNVQIDYPVTPDDFYQAASGAQCVFEDANGTDYYGALFRSSATTSTVRVFNSSGTYVSPTNVTSTVPFTWASTDRLIVNGVYRAA
jgi:hypothetical protein